MPGAPHTFQGPDPPRAGQCAAGGHTGDLVGQQGLIPPRGHLLLSALLWAPHVWLPDLTRPFPACHLSAQEVSAQSFCQVSPSVWPHASFSVVPCLPCLGLGAPRRPLTTSSDPLTTVLLLQPQILLFLPTLSFNVFVPQGSAQRSPPP